MQHAYDRLAAFSLFLEEGYNQRPEARRLPRLTSEAISALIFEVIYGELHTRRNAQGLPRELPQLIYACLAPFMGPHAAQRFVVAKVA